MEENKFIIVHTPSHSRISRHFLSQLSKSLFPPNSIYTATARNDVQSFLVLQIAAIFWSQQDALSLLWQWELFCRSKIEIAIRSWVSAMPSASDYLLCLGDRGGERQWAYAIGQIGQWCRANKPKAAASLTADHAHAWIKWSHDECLAHPLSLLSPAFEKQKPNRS